MIYETQTVLNKNGLQQLFDTHDLDALASIAGLPKGTLKNYKYGQTPLTNLPLATLEKLSQVVLGSDFFNSNSNLHFRSRDAFLAFREQTKHRTYPGITASELMKAQLILEKRKNENHAHKPIWFFVDFDNLDNIVWLNPMPGEAHHFVIQSIEQFERIYGKSLSELIPNAKTTVEQYNTSTNFESALYAMGVQHRLNDPVWKKHNIFFVSTSNTPPLGDNPLGGNVFENQSLYAFDHVDHVFYASSPIATDILEPFMATPWSTIKVPSRTLKDYSFYVLQQITSREGNVWYENAKATLHNIITSDELPNVLFKQNTQLVEKLAESYLDNYAKESVTDSALKSSLVAATSVLYRDWYGRAHEAIITES